MPTRPPYSRLRIAVGGGAGVGATTEGPGYAVSAFAGLGWPLTGDIYARLDAFFTYLETRVVEDATFYHSSPGHASSAPGKTTVISGYVLLGLRPLVGFQLSPEIGLRLGPVGGFSSASVASNSCYAKTGTSFSGLVLGGDVSLVFHLAGAEIGFAADAYRMRTRANCEGQGERTPEEGLAAVLVAQTSFFF